MANLEESLQAIETNNRLLLADLGAIGMAAHLSLNVMGLRASLEGVGEENTAVLDGIVTLETMAAIFQDLMDLYPGAINAAEAVMAYVARQRGA